MAAELLASDVLPPRMVSSRGMMGMLSRLESDSAGITSSNSYPPTSTFFANRAGVCSDWSWLPRFCTEVCHRIGFAVCEKCRCII